MYQFKKIGDEYFVIDGFNETLAVVAPDGLTAKNEVIAELDKICPQDQTLIEFIRRQATGL
jgi:hypothetical protein